MNVKYKIHRAWVLLEPTLVRHGCVIGYVDNDPKQDIMTSPVVSYEMSADRKQLRVITKSGSLCEIVEPDEDFIKDLLEYMGDK